MGLDVDSQEVLSQQACDDEVRMISLVFNSSDLTPPMLTPLGDYFKNFASTFYSSENVGEVSCLHLRKILAKTLCLLHLLLLMLLILLSMLLLGRRPKKLRL